MSDEFRISFKNILQKNGTLSTKALPFARIQDKGSFLGCPDTKRSQLVEKSRTRKRLMKQEANLSPRLPATYILWRHRLLFLSGSQCILQRISLFFKKKK
ncbi:hypothetical protein CEXT_757961 [Caerostris extrusa]|uniref:Uncharacterized protein n=1 Tax=Caerostris extrusa TaxID=172846 RepID=A0AAV4M945_CAEEX|nr:hypothetical protein CEXT_757961 [Caerostris extrusa]